MQISQVVIDNYIAKCYAENLLEAFAPQEVFFFGYMYAFIMPIED